VALGVTWPAATGLILKGLELNGANRRMCISYTNNLDVTNIMVMMGAHLCREIRRALLENHL
jgi:hypothetical protein